MFTHQKLFHWLQSYENGFIINAAIELEPYVGSIW